MYLPPEVMREILSYLIVPRTMSLSKTMRSVEESLYRYRIESIKRTYISFTNGRLTIDLCDDREALAFVMRYPNRFDIAHYDYCIFVKHLAMYNMRDLLFKILDGAGKEERCIAKFKTRDIYTYAYIGAFVSNNTIMQTQIVDTYGHKIDYVVLDKYSRAYKNGVPLPSILDMAARYGNGDDILSMFKNRIYLGIPQDRKMIFDKIIECFMTNSKLINELTRLILPEMFLNNKDVNEFHDYMSILTNGNIPISVLLKVAERRIMGRDDPQNIDVLVSYGLIDTCLDGVHKNRKISSTYTYLAVVAMKYHRLEILKYFMNKGVSADRVLNAVRPTTPQACIDLINKYR